MRDLSLLVKRSLKIYVSQVELVSSIIEFTVVHSINPSAMGDSMYGF